MSRIHVSPCIKDDCLECMLSVATVGGGGGGGGIPSSLELLSFTEGTGTVLVGVLG